MQWLDISEETESLYYLPEFFWLVIGLKAKLRQGPSFLIQESKLRIEHMLNPLPSVHNFYKYLPSIFQENT